MSEADKRWLQVPVGTITPSSQVVMESMLKNVRKRIKARRPKIIEPTRKLCFYLLKKKRFPFCTFTNYQYLLLTYLKYRNEISIF